MQVSLHSLRGTVANFAAAAKSFKTKVSQVAKSLLGISAPQKSTSAPLEVIKKTKRIEIELSPTHSIIYTPTDGTYTYISPAPAIKNLVISGGGAKGVILLGAVQAFEEHQENGISFKEQLEVIAGSSVGALTASLLAAGITAEELIKATSSENFKALLGKGYGPLYKDGNPLLAFIRTHLEAATGLKGPVTFAMLHELHMQDPKKYKELIVTATCRETGKTYYFDHNNTPNLEIALACRASASLPGILQAVEIDGNDLLPGYPHNHPVTFVDGGYLDNIPVVVLENDKMMHAGDDGQNLQTLALIFDETGRKAHEQSPFHEVKPKKAIYNPHSRIERLVRDVVAKRLGKINTTERNTLTRSDRLEEMRTRYSSRCIPLLVDLKATDFVKAKKHEQAYIQSGKAQCLEYLKNRECEAIYRYFASQEELLAHVPQELRANLVARLDSYK